MVFSWVEKSGVKTSVMEVKEWKSPEWKCPSTVLIPCKVPVRYLYALYIQGEPGQVGKLYMVI